MPEFCIVPHGSPAYDETVQLRYKILRQPLGLTFTPEQLAAESSDFHLAAYDDASLIACLVLTPVDSTTIKMRQVAVDEGMQGRGIGRSLVEYSERVARENGFQQMVLSARETAVPFYLRLNYVVIGEPYEEVTIPHRKMRKSLD